MAALRGLGRSNGCAFSDGPSHIPLQRMANVSLQPAAGGPSTADLIARVEDGIYILGDKSWSIDMQRYNFQFTGQRFFKIKNGRLAGQLRDVAYQATTNGGPRSRQLTVIAIDRRGPDGAATGVVSRAGVRPDQIEDVVREAEHAAAEGTPAEDAAELPGPEQAGSFGTRSEETGQQAGRERAGSFGIKSTEEPGWDSPARRTEIGVPRDFPTARGETLRGAQAPGRQRD